MQAAPSYGDVVAEVSTFFENRLARLDQSGVGREHVVLDPGLGFGKTLEHNLQLLAALNSFTKWNRPVLLGASRKSFLAHFARGGDAKDRLPGSLACACWGAQRGVNIMRVHDVAATRQALSVTESILRGRPEAARREPTKD